MSGLDRKLDPSTGDYVADDAGGWETTRSAQNAIYHQIKGELDRWVGDPQAGSRFYTLARAKSSVRTPQVVVDIARQALARLVAVGRITAPEIETERDRDRILQRIVTTDLETGEQLDLTDLLPFSV